MLWSTLWLASFMIQETDIHESLTVRRRLVEVRVVDVFGRPRMDLTADDFRLTQKRTEIPVQTCVWVDAGEGLTVPEQGLYGGRLVTLFFQVGLESSRVAGLRAKLTRVAHVISKLNLESDRIAVLSYDSRLRLWTDFTNDHLHVMEVARKALRRERFIQPAGQDFPSLAANLDQQGAADADTPEKALVQLGAALAPFEGSKTLVYMSFDSADSQRGNPMLRHDYPAALQAITDARVTIYGLAFAGGAPGVRQIAEDSGGFYVHAPQFFEMAINKFARANTGYYLLSHEMPEGIDPEGNFKIKLREGRGRVLAMSPYNSWGDGMTRPKKLRKERREQWRD